ncbi:mitogen-activated protein kinase kinase kinase 1 isoform X2 [Neltuma alba]|uniref:mitogen-activated protein kinase kinase kinase 1-like isoform X2 n=1 Tax=Neltuma alba TaxID=207710 RepID=UPI0010A3BEE7|nr:mitogen-activated protein kinase kinase kinase 1-like isoform X2 [Prosopis alba]XP_028800977.1 mitogen-activated protein kinase kinase kinase 1-like isoform X2 [Prosopis alba]
MDAKRRKPLQTKLERRNAMKNIDYQAPTTSYDEVASLDLLRQTSYRLKGFDDEVDLLFRGLGLSGPEDFEIPTAEWRAREARSIHSDSNPLIEKARDEIQIPAEFQRRVEINSDIELKGKKLQAGMERKITVAYSNSNALGSNQDGGRVIKSVRPSVLLPPPPGMVRRPIANRVTDFPIQVRRIRSTGEDEVRVPKGNEEAVDGDEDGGGGDKGTGVVDESVLNVSPYGSFRCAFSCWQKGEILGKGSFGTVYEGFTSDGFFFAVKEVSLLDEGSQGKQSIFQLQQEISLLSRFEHENIVRYLGSDKDESKLYIFLELLTKGSLANLYRKYHLRDSQVSAYTRQILSGLKYLHDCNVVHRDIKCANILVDASGSVKLADFGLAKATKFNDLRSSKGSPYWMAPEVVNLKSRGYGPAADIWSLGCTVLEMLTRQSPYSELEGMQALFRIGRGEPPPIPESISKDARDFIQRCIQVNPEKRPTAAILLEHKFVKRKFLPPIIPAPPLVNDFRS